MTDVEKSIFSSRDGRFRLRGNARFRAVLDCAVCRTSPRAILMLAMRRYEDVAHSSSSRLKDEGSARAATRGKKLGQGETVLVIGPARGESENDQRHAQTLPAVETPALADFASSRSPRR